MAQTSEQLIHLLTAHQVHLEQYKAGATARFFAVLGQVETKLVRMVQRLDVAALNDLSKAQLRALLADALALQEAALEKAVLAHLAELEKLAGQEAAFDATALERIAAVAASVPLAQKAFQRARLMPLSATGQLLEPFVRGWKTRQLTAVNNILRKGYSDGWTVQQMTQAIRGTRSRNYRDGVIAGSRRMIQAVVRTAIQHTSATAREATWLANPDVVTGYRLVATLDSRTSPVCRSLDGREFELGKGPTPPLHVGCRTTTVPTIAQEFDLLGKKNAKRASAGGAVPAETTYYQWLKGQPAEFQDSVLGPVRGKLLRDGGLSAERFAALNLDRNFNPLDLDAMRRRAPQAFKLAGI